MRGLTGSVDAARARSIAVRAGLWAAVLCAGAAAFGCRDDDRERAYESLRDLPAPELRRAVLSMAPDEQVATYAYGTEHFRPGDLTLLPILVDEGGIVLPALVARLERADAAASTQELVMVVYQMAVVRHLPEASTLGPRVDAWCSRAYPAGSYCHQMGREIVAAASVAGR